MHRHLLILMLLLCCLGVNAQQQQDTAFRKLYKQYFKLYNEPEKEKEFWETSEKLKAYYKAQGRQRSYYKIRQNEVLYLVDHGRAYQAIKRSSEILEEMKTEGVRHFDMVYTSLATVYESRGNYRMAENYFMEALKNANAKDSGALISIYSRIASLQSTREPKEAWEWNEKFGALAKIYPDYYKMYLSQKGRISFFMLDKPKFLKAQAEFKDYLKQHHFVDSTGIVAMKVYDNAFNGQYQEALALLEDDVPGLDMITIHDVKGKIYEMMGRYVLCMKESAIRRDLRDSLNSDLLYDNINAVNAEAGLTLLSDKAAQEREELNAKAAKERERWFAAVIALLAVALGLVASRYLQKRRYQKKLLKQNKELEIALDRAKESDRMKTSFIEQVSHEIRTPLNVITGFAQVITNPHYELEEKERNNMINDISKNTVEITNLVNELLEVAEDESREHYERNDNVNIHQLCQEVINSASVINNGRLQLNYKNMLDQDFTLRTNKIALKKILNQLMKNALKFTKEGEIELKIRERAANGGVEFTITDTGIGIDEKYHSKIFERFYKVDTFKQGLGLGLTMSRKMAELLGGSLDIDDSYKKGARFVLILPS